MNQRLELHRVEVSPHALGLLVIDRAQGSAFGTRSTVLRVFKVDVDPAPEDVQVDVRHTPLFAKAEKRCVMLVESILHEWNYTTWKWNAVEVCEAVKR